MITGLLIFYAIVGFLAVIGALITYAVLTSQEEEKRKQHGH
jgi:uncharacterized membrane protein YuzA (DUF378 family)